MHFPSHLREAFCEWADGGCQPDAWVEVHYERELWPSERLLGRMVHCSDVLPGCVCDVLDVPQGTSYAAAAQRLLRERRAKVAAR
jgi:hypothetical protein